MKYGVYVECSCGWEGGQDLAQNDSRDLADRVEEAWKAVARSHLLSHPECDYARREAERLKAA
jgi:hypothetical protein